MCLALAPWRLLRQAARAAGRTLVQTRGIRLYEPLGTVPWSAELMSSSGIHLFHTSM